MRMPIPPMMQLGGALQNNPALCSYGYNPNCSSGSSTPPPKKIIYHDVMVPSKFGALAVSVKAGYIAGSLNHGSKEEAQREAVKRCRQGSRNTPCKAITWVRNGCLAAAKGKVKNNQFIYLMQQVHKELSNKRLCRIAETEGRPNAKLSCLKAAPCPNCSNSTPSEGRLKILSDGP